MEVKLKGLVLLNKLNKSNTPDLKNVYNLNENKIKRDVWQNLPDYLSNKMNPQLNSFINNENLRLEEKKIINNKSSQFGPILGVNFHNIKR